jgi:hypothetical protein
MSQEFRLGQPRPTPEGEVVAAGRLPEPGTSDLIAPLLPPLTLPGRAEDRDYGPRPWLEYLLELNGPLPFCRSRLLSLLSDPLLCELGSPELYAQPLGEERWTFLRAGVVAEELAAAVIGWNLAPRESDPPPPAALRRWRDVLAHRLRPLGVRLRAREAVERACERGGELVRLREDWDVGVAFVLRAPWHRRYDGRDLWEAAHALGLEWGHLAIFHWLNRGGPGDERLFSLWSLEEPGTFSPERVAAGMTVGEVALGYSIARSPNPIAVFDRMVLAGRYLQRRLGGKLLVGPVSVATDRTLQLWRGRVRTAVEELTAAGFPPGSSRTMQLF